MNSRTFRLGAVALVAIVGLVGIGTVPAAAAGPPVRTGTATIADENGNFTPGVASNGTETLVVWEKRNGQNGLADVYGRLTATDANGTRVNSVRISLRAADEYAPDVAWTGSSFLVVWETQIGSGRQEIHGRRVSKDGALLGSELAISARNAAQNTPSVAAGKDGQFLVAWEDDRNDATTARDIYAKRVSPTGTVLDGSGIRLSGDSTGSAVDDSDPDVAWNGSTYLIVYTGDDVGRNIKGIFGGRVSPSGVSANAGFIGGGTLGGGGDNFDAFEPTVAGSGGFFVVAWAEEIPNANGLEIQAVRFNGSSGERDIFRVSSATGDQRAPTIAFNGVFVVVWVDRRAGKNELWGARVDPNGAVVDQSGFLVTNDFPSNKHATLTRGSSATQTFTLGWEINPDTDSAGVQAIGLGPAPK